MMYNGHKNWNHWNVSLWLNNDERLYRMAKGYAETFGIKLGAGGLFEELIAEGVTHTPDGAPFSVTTLRAAMRGINS